MDVNDDASMLNERGVFEFFASKHAPTRFCRLLMDETCH
jgi:hypothetical protein